MTVIALAIIVVPALYLIERKTTPNEHSPGGADGHYTSLTELRDAAVDAGLDCSSWTLATVESGEGGHCGDSVSLNLFSDHEDATQAANNLGDMLGSMGINYTTLLGDNWFIQLPSSNASELQDVLGGEIITGP